MAQSKLGELIDTAFEAAIDSSRWSQLFEKIAHSLGGSSTLAVTLDMKTRAIEKSVSAWCPPKALEEYLQGYHFSDPKVPLAFAFKGLGTFLDNGDCEMTDRSTADFQKWQDARIRSAHQLTLVVPYDAGRKRLVACIHQSREAGPTTRQLRNDLHRHLPKLAQAISLGFHHQELLLNAFWDGITEAQRSKNVALLDADGQVLRHTEGMHYLLDRDAGFDIVKGRFHAWQTEETERLRGIINAATRLVLPSPGAMTLTRRLRSPLLLAAYPLSRKVRMMAPAEAAAMVVIQNPLDRRSTQSQILRQAFDLSGREAEVAGAMMDGHSPESLAHAFGIAMPTVRTHLRRIFEKTNTSSQADLIRLLSRLC